MQNMTCEKAVGNKMKHCQKIECFKKSQVYKKFSFLKLNSTLFFFFESRGRMVGYYNDWLFYVVTIVRMSGDVIQGNILGK